MAYPSSRTINYDALLTMTFENLRENLIDQIFSDTVLLAAIYGKIGGKKKSGSGVRYVDGGERISQNLMYGKNTTVKSYAGYEALDVTPQEGFTRAFFTPRQVAGSVTISGAELAKNNGKEKIIDLLEAKFKQLRMSFAEELNSQMLGKTISGGAFIAGRGSQSAGTDLDPLLMLIPKDPTASVEVGNINQATYSWWRPYTVDGSAAHGGKDSGADRGFNITSFAILNNAMMHAYNSCARSGGGAPDIVLTDQLTYETYNLSFEDKKRYTNDDSGPVSMGFDSVRYKGADMIWDYMMPDVDGGYAYDSASFATGTMLFLNTQFIDLTVFRNRDFIIEPFVKPAEQDAKVANMLFMGNMTCSNRRKLGIIYGITQGIVS